ncbi:hypothetical protein HN51_022608 [Arachis hypogaea]
MFSFSLSIRRFLFWKSIWNKRLLPFSPPTSNFASASSSLFRPPPTALLSENQQGCVSSPSDSSYKRNGLKSKSKFDSVSSSSGSSNGSEESSLPSMFKPAKKGNNNNNKNKVKVKNSGSASSPSLSPPRRAGCFWCSPRKDSKKKSKEVDWSVLGWHKDDELLSDLGSFSSKKQLKILKKALKEEQKISRIIITTLLSVF